MKIVDYKIIENHPTSKPTTDEFVGMVNAAIREGWQPLGGVLRHNAHIYHAVVRYAESVQPGIPPVRPPVRKP